MRARRDSIRSLIDSSSKPITGSMLAKQFDVSRQVIVQDIALLRAEGVSIIATSQGYMITETHDRIKRIIACQHLEREKLIRELTLIVDMGGVIEDVIIEHPVYGEIIGRIMVQDRAGVDVFTKKLFADNSQPISVITDGIHLHTISAKSEVLLDAIEDVLEKNGILINN